jgi:hypothetical protein
MGGAGFEGRRGQWIRLGAEIRGFRSCLFFTEKKRRRAEHSCGGGQTKPDGANTELAK